LHGCTECTVGGTQMPCPESGRPVIGAIGSRRPNAMYYPLKRLSTSVEKSEIVVLTSS
jgi:hypothetical protein